MSLKVVRAPYLRLIRRVRNGKLEEFFITKKPGPVANANPGGERLRRSRVVRDKSKKSGFRWEPLVKEG